MSTSNILSNTLFGRTRSALLSTLFGHVGESFYLRQLSRLTGIAVGAVQRELRQLVDAGLLATHSLGVHTLYTANRQSPVFPEIKSLVAKTVGTHDALQTALEPLRKKITLAFVYGSVARSAETPHSDVDLLVVGKADFSEVVRNLSNAQAILGREINPTVYSVREFTDKLRGNFLKTVIAGEKLYIIGGDHVLRELGEKQLAGTPRV